MSADLDEIVHSTMYIEGRENAASSLPYKCPYSPASEAAEDYLKGYREYFNGRGGDAEGEFALL